MNRIHPIDPSLSRPRLQRCNLKVDELAKPVLVRQTNEHERLPDYLLNRWWNSNVEEKKIIWLEYDATWS